MRERRSPARARQSARAPHRVASGMRNSPVRSTRSLNAPTDDEYRKSDRERRERAAADRPAQTAAIATPRDPAAVSRCADAERSPRFHASSGPNGIATSSGTNSGPKVEIEERRADRDPLAGQHFQRQRIQRSDEYRRAGGGEEQIVEHQRALARDRREQPALLQRGGAPGEQRKAAADEQASGSGG